MAKQDVSEVELSLYERLEDNDNYEDILLLRWSFTRFGKSWTLMAVHDLLERVELEHEVILVAIDTALHGLSSEGCLTLCLHDSGDAQAIKYLLEPPEVCSDPLEVWVPPNLHQTVAARARELGFVFAA